MKILVLSNTPWNNNNSFGNSFSSIFEGMDDIEIANIYCQNGNPDNSVVTKYFQITEKMLIRNLLDKKKPSGIEVFEKNQPKMSEKEESVLTYAKKKRWWIMFWARDFIWKIGRWESPELKKFIDEFNPDLLFMPIYYSNYLNDIVGFIKKYTQKPMLGYISDDNYTLRQFNLSPFYWIDRLHKRKKVKNSVMCCEHLYVISEIQKREYENCFQIPCKVLWKGADFYNKPQYSKNHGIIKLIYTGNIGAGRYKQLATIGEVLKQINQEEKKAELDIYTLTPMTDKMKKALDIPNAINLKGGVGASEIARIQESADVLVHVESFDLKSRLAVHQSFSTKIVDYLYRAKCILAVGPEDVASIEYLRNNDAAVTAVNKNELVKVMEELVRDRTLLDTYGEKAWECGKRNHQRKEIQEMLQRDFEEIIHESSTNQRSL